MEETASGRQNAPRANGGQGHMPIMPQERGSRTRHKKVPLPRQANPRTTGLVQTNSEHRGIHMWSTMMAFWSYRYKVPTCQGGLQCVLDGGVRTLGPRGAGNHQPQISTEGTPSDTLVLGAQEEAGASGGPTATTQVQQRRGTAGAQGTAQTERGAC